MELLVRIREPRTVHMRIDLSRRNIRMAEHLLDDAQIRAVAQEMRRERMAQHVRIDILFNARDPRRLRHDHPYSFARQGLPCARQKELQRPPAFVQFRPCLLKIRHQQLL